MMLVLLGVILLLGFWSSKNENAIIMSVVNHFELWMGLAAVTVIVICLFSYILSVAFFKKKYA